MQRKSFRFLTLFILLALVTSLALPVFAQEAAPPTQQTGPLQILEISGDDAKDASANVKAADAGFLFSDVPTGMSFFNETEPNDTSATANALPGSQVVAYGTISPAVDVDYFSFTASAGDRVYAATMTQFSNGGSTDTIVDVIASDGTTILETDDDSGSFSGTASAIGGTIIPAAGTYYVRVDGFSTTATITPYHLHVRVQSGTPTAEVEPNNDLATATPLAASGWMSGTITATSTAGEADFFSFNLNAGDSVFLGLDMDPGRLPSNTNWNGRLGFGIFAGNQILVVNDGSTTKPHAEAFFMTVQQAGTYYAYIDSTSATGLGANARYNLSVSIYPKQVQNNCTTITSTAVPVTIGPAAGTATSTIVVPGTVTSSITDINATIVLTHSLMADLDVTLVGPTAASTALFTDIGSTATGGQTQMNVGLDDQAALPIGPYTVVSGMVNQPEQPGRLATFNGTPAAGTWTLQLADDTTNTSGGRLQSWSLEICGDPPPPFAIELNKTVGVEPAVCATTDSITVPPGGFDVYYCYTVRNTGLNTLNVHDLVDSELGTIFTGVNYALAPGATYSHIQQATIYDTVTNTGTWTAYNPSDGNPSASDSDTATVNVRQQMCPAGYQPVTVDASFFDNPFPPAGWSVTNTTTNCNAAGAVPQWTNTNPGARANLTGGVGPFAIADSDKCGTGSSLNSIMSTGMLDFTGMISPTVSFNTDYDDLGVGDDRAILASSTDGGTTWAPLFTWDSDHRGPLLVTQPLPGAGENDVMVRWDYASTWDWWWEVDNAFLTACEPIPSDPAISLDKTVGTSTLVCATTDEITLPPGGGEVTYCYEVTNTGGVTLERHDLVDSELGALLNNFPYSLAPGASAFITATTNIAVTTVNTATWTAYNPADGFVSVSATDAATVTVEAVVDPNIDVSPLSLASTQATNTTTNQPLTVANTGGGTLNWQIAEENPLAPPGAVVVNPASAREDVGGAAAPGAPQAAPDGVSVWRAPEAVLWDNGPLVNFPGGGAGGADESRLQNTSLAMSTLGFGHQVVNNNWVADDFTVSDAGGWTVDTATFFAYQTNSTTTSTMTYVNWVLYNGDPSAGGTVIVSGGGLLSTAWANIYRTTETTIGVTNRPIMANTVSLSGLFLPAGTYWLAWQTNGTLASGPWAPPITINGQATTGNGLQSLAGGAFAPAIDTGSSTQQGFPFILEGTVSGGGQECTSPSNIPWLSLNVTSGSNTGGTNTLVTATFDSTGLAAGAYTGNLCTTSNDPDPGPGNGTDLVIVPVTLTVEAVTVPNIDVSPLSLASTQATNTTTNQPLTVANTGGGTLNWQIAEDTVLVTPVGPAPEMPAPAAGTTGSRSGSAGGPAPIAYDSPADFSEGFDDITVLPGWAVQNNSAPLGLTNWFQGNDTVFPAQAGAPTAYIGANFNNTSGVGTISNWLMTPQITMNNGDTLSFWTRGPAGSIFPDRLQVRLSTAGASTNVGTLATDVGDFTTLLLDINPTLAVGGYPEAWTQYTITLSGLPANASGRIAWRYFVTNGGPSGANSDYIGIDTVEYTAVQAAVCDAPSAIPWLTETPSSGATAGGGSTPVSVGFDSTSLAAGTYTANLCVTSDDPDPGPGNGTDLVIVPVTLTVTAVTVPNIDVSPLSLSSSQAPNTTTQQQVNVGNTGGSNLTWSIFEDVSGSPDMVDWSDNFDSYATGSQLHGQGGWKGWFNDPAAGALASSTQARSAPNSADIVGASDLVHEYSGYTSGPWVYTAWQYAPTDMTGSSYFILLNQYDDAGATNNWSTQVQFDSAQNLVINDGVSGGTLPLVKGQWVEVRVEIDLTANTQAFYYNNQLLYQGTWTEENSGSGALAIGAVDLFANGASTVYYDDLSLAAPAQPVACDAPADIPWASVNPTAGTTPGGGSTPVNVTFDSTGLIPGVYTGNLCVDSNDPDPGPGNGTDLVIVPLTLTVETGTAVTLSNLTADASQSPAPAGAPLAALPAVAGLAMAAFYALRRKR